MIVCIDTNTVVQALIFTDCAITADADYLLTEDAHFAPLVDVAYKPRPISPQEFIARFIASGPTKGL